MVTRTKKSTVREIARVAGVSPTTASLVLNRKGQISAATRSHVLEVAATLEFTPRPSRKRPDSVKSIQFLKIAKHGNTVNRDHNHFISDYIDGMSEEASRRGYKLQVISHELTPISTILDLLSGSGARGVIALGTELSESDVRLIQSCALPTVFIDTFYDGIEANFVDMNNYDTVHKVLSYLKGQGFREIGFVGSDVKTENFSLRREAFFRSVEILGLKVAKAHVLSIGSTLHDAHRDSLEALAGAKGLAQAYFCANDVMALGFIRALKEMGLGIPDDVAVVGFDNLPMSTIVEPPLTTVDVSKRRIGGLAVGLLHDIMTAPHSSPPVKILVGAELVVRSSAKPSRERQDKPLIALED
ncbi:MAG: LacI family DNA-binding transcriptional regulator [Ancalomicrobiaceae bacterium]|nr:LacI family DNA-binding transcriptional regulator [Ancalomicrobiaceae bacterium]